MNKTPDEIKKGLECHSRPCGCDMGCPYVDVCAEDEGCPMSADALAYIQQLEAERDAYFAEIHGRCRFCVNSDGVTDDCDNICERCESDCPCKDCDGGNKWQWRGVQKEE